MADAIAIACRRSKQTACEARAVYDPASPCVYYRAGLCGCGRASQCQHEVASVCTCGGICGRVGQREYRGGPPEQIGQEVDLE